MYIQNRKFRWKKGNFIQFSSSFSSSQKIAAHFLLNLLKLFNLKLKTKALHFWNRGSKISVPTYRNYTLHHLWSKSELLYVWVYTHEDTIFSSFQFNDFKCIYGISMEGVFHFFTLSLSMFIGYTKEFDRFYSFFSIDASGRIAFQQNITGDLSFLHDLLHRHLCRRRSIHF